MTKIDLYPEIKLLMLLSPMTSINSYSKNKLSMPFSPICKNYVKIILNIGPDSATTADVNESTGAKPCHSLHQF